MPSKGYVYVLTNPSMPGMVKIGKTTRDVEQRANELFQTGVPTPFDIEAWFLSPDCDQLETDAHAFLSKFRVSTSREFFSARASDAVEAVERLLLSQVSDMVHEYLDGYILVQSECAVSEADIGILADQANRHPFEIVSALECILPSELAPALSRYDEKINRRPPSGERIQ